MSRKRKDDDHDDWNAHTPCYVIADAGSRGYSVSYEDGWSYASSQHLGNAPDYDTARDLIKADIRRSNGEANGLPVFTVSDHGNSLRVRAIRLRKIARH